MARRTKRPLSIYLEPAHYEHLVALAKQNQQSINECVVSLLLKALKDEQRPLTVAERLDRLEADVAAIRVRLGLGHGPYPDHF